MRFRGLALGVGFVLALMAACGDDTTSEDDDGASVTVSSASAGGAATSSTGTSSTTASTSNSTSNSTAASTTSSTGATGGTGGMSVGGAGGGGGPSGPCLGATPLTLGGAASEVINPAGDEDEFTFNATAGDWIALVIDANPLDDPMLVDTVITLYDPNGTQVAENDDALPRVSTDSELLYHVPQTGSYCVLVQEYSEWSGGLPEGDPTFAYQLFAELLDPVNFSWFNQDTDPTPANDTQQTAQALTLDPDLQGGNFGQIAGLLEPGTDVDFYSYATTGGTLTTSIALMPQGPSGYGSTQGPGVIRLRNSSGVVAELDYQLGSPALDFPAVGAGAYYIEVNRPNTTVGTNDSFYFKLVNAPFANQDESESNGTAGTADVATPQVNGTFTSHFVRGMLSSSSDVDYWSFNAFAGQALTVVCRAARAGSGLLGFNVAARNPADTATLQTETESTTQDLNWSTSPGASMAPVALNQTGTHYVRLTATGQKSGVSGTYYICGLHVQ